MKSFDRKQLEQPIPIEQALNHLSSISSHELFSPKRLYFMEIWIGATFGERLGYNHIRLATKAQKGFDLYLCKDGAEQKYEVTECRGEHTDNRNTLYYHCDKIISQDDESIVEDRARFERAVSNKLEKKARQLSLESRLLVYVNTGWRPSQPKIDSCLNAWRDKYASRFASAHLLLSNEIIQLVPESQ